MDKNNKSVEPTPDNFANCGVFVTGVVVSNRGKVFVRKDGSGTTVCVEHEIALRPGVAIWQRYFDPKKDDCVRIEGEAVAEFPKLKEFQQVKIRATRVRTDEHTGQLVIKGGELVV